MLLHLKPTPSWIKSYHCFQYLMWGRKGYTGGDNETSWKETIQRLVMASCPPNGLLVGSIDDKSTLPQSQQLGVSTAAVIYIAMVIRQYFRGYTLQTLTIPVLKVTSHPARETLRYTVECSTSSS